MSKQRQTHMGFKPISFNHKLNRRKTCFIVLKMIAVLGLDALKSGFAGVVSAAKSSSLLSDSSWIKKPEDENETIE